MKLITSLNARQAFVPPTPMSLRFESLVEDLASRQWTFDEPGQAEIGKADQGEGCILVQMAVRRGGQLGVMSNREILQTPVSVQANTACADPAQRHRDLRQVISRELPGHSHLTHVNVYPEIVNVYVTDVKWYDWQSFSVSHPLLFRQT